MSRFISQDRLTTTVGRQCELVCDLSNAVISDDLDRVVPQGYEIRQRQTSQKWQKTAIM